MAIKNTFKFAARWDSVGLDCSNCVHFQGPQKWPDINGESRCVKHRISLRFELLESGFKEGEWFCKTFKDNGTAFPKAVKHFNEIKDQLEENKLYGFHLKDGFLAEYEFNAVDQMAMRKVSRETKHGDG